MYYLVNVETLHLFPCVKLKINNLKTKYIPSQYLLALLSKPHLFFLRIPLQYNYITINIFQSRNYQLNIL